MGGIGSGRSRWSARQAVERSVALSLPALLREGKLTEHPSVQRGAGFTLRIRPDGARLRVCVVELGQTIWLESTPANLGGIRWWVVCPGCNSRRTALYLSEPKQWFYCRECLNLSYRSRQEHRAFDRLYGELASKLAARGEQATAADVERIHREAKKRSRPRWLRKRERPQANVEDRQIEQTPADLFLKAKMVGLR